VCGVLRAAHACVAPSAPAIAERVNIGFRPNQVLVKEILVDGVCVKTPSQLPCRQVVGWCSRPAGGADRCRGSEPSCGPAAARRRGAEQCHRSGFIPACRR